MGRTRSPWTLLHVGEVPWPRARLLAALGLLQADAPLLACDLGFDASFAGRAASWRRMEPAQWRAQCSGRAILVSAGLVALIRALPGWECPAARGGELMAALSTCLLDALGTEPRSVQDLLDLPGLRPELLRQPRSNRYGWAEQWFSAWSRCPDAPGDLGQLCMQPLSSAGLLEMAMDDAPAARLPVELAWSPEFEPAPAQELQQCAASVLPLMLPAGSMLRAEATPPPILCVTADERRRRDVVLTIGAGASIDPAVVRLFVSSLRATGSQAEIVLFLDGRVAGAFVPLARQFGGVRILSFNATALELAYGKVVIYRFALYADFLARQPPGRYRNCLHADMFDTFFQRDPFAAVDVRGGLVLFAENPEIELGDCRFHRHWFGQCREAPLLYAVHTLPRVCMGVVMGTVPAMVRMLRMLMPNLGSPHRCNDQGVLNIMLWSGELAARMPVRVQTAAVGVTINANTDWALELRSDGLLHGAKGAVFAIVHQYDRIARACPPGAAAPLCHNGMPADQRQSAVRSTFSVPKCDHQPTAAIPHACAVLTSSSSSFFFPLLFIYLFLLYFGVP